MSDVTPDAPHIFICFSSTDEIIAREVVSRLEAEGLPCWISLRDVAPGHNYQEAIISALESAKGVVFLFSEFSSASGETKKELSVAGSLNMPVIPLRLTPITPSGALRYELATRQWVDLFPDREQGFRRLVSAVRRVLDPAAVNELARGSLRPPERTASLGVENSPVASSSAAPAQTPAVAPGTPEFEALRALLARYIGPIAKVYLARAVSHALSIDDLCALLSTHVDSPSDRAAFLKEARSRSAPRS